MNLKPLFIILFTSLTVVAQQKDVKQQIANEFTEYQEAISDKDFEKALDYIVPGFFEIYPKADLLKLMEQSFNNPDITFEITNLKIENIEAPEHIDEKHYALLTYSNQMNMKFMSQDSLTDEEKKSRISMTLISLEQSFGSNNVSYDAATDFFRVKAEKQVYAISENGSSDWKFLAIEKGQKAILEQLLPAELSRKL
ncbi:hypothetical protein [Robertkochia flava]|uniref:hypothetical protein n=1 Tax=Robertkochia flava TaxID=3447986 RepID=UPI001CCECC67|nr:hypothetical protein [Robertkochia marina]